MKRIFSGVKVDEVCCTADCVHSAYVCRRHVAVRELFFSRLSVISISIINFMSFLSIHWFIDYLCMCQNIIINKRLNIEKHSVNSRLI